VCPRLVIGVVAVVAAVGKGAPVPHPFWTPCPAPGVAAVAEAVWAPGPVGETRPDPWDGEGPEAVAQGLGVGMGGSRQPGRSPYTHPPRYRTSRRLHRWGQGAPAVADPAETGAPSREWIARFPPVPERTPSNPDPWVPPVPGRWSGPDAEGRESGLPGPEASGAGSPELEAVGVAAPGMGARAARAPAGPGRAGCILHRRNRFRWEGRPRKQVPSPPDRPLSRRRGPLRPNPQEMCLPGSPR